MEICTRDLIAPGSIDPKRTGGDLLYSTSAGQFRRSGTDRPPPVDPFQRPPTEIPLLLTAIFRERRRSRSPILGTRSMGGGSGC